MEWVFASIVTINIAIIGGLWRRVWKLQSNDMRHIILRLDAHSADIKELRKDVGEMFREHLQMHIDNK